MSPRARWFAGLATTALFLGAHTALGGLRSDHAWLALAGLAVWVAPGRTRPYALFIAPFLIMAAVYDAQRYWAPALRGTVHVAEPHAWELAWFGIASAAGKITPAAWWQLHPHAALDLVCGAVYLLFIPVFIALAAWWRFREQRPEAQDVMWAMLWLNLAAYAIYLLYPAAPPWYVERYGLGPAVLTALPESGGAARFDALLGVSWFAQFYGRSANVFGAIPSLHVGQTFLAALYAWRFRSLRGVATGFWALVAFASIYLNHHYVVDGLIGMALATGAMLAVSACSLAGSAPGAERPVIVLGRFLGYLVMRGLSLRRRADLFLDEKFHRIKRHYGARCLDVGSGYGDFAQFLRSNGIATTTIDVVDKGRHPENPTQVFDGRTIPFPAKSFDTSITMFVLHHAQDQMFLLRELGRVTRQRVIIAEDVMETVADKLFGSIHLKTSVWSQAKDSFHADAEWRKIFAALGWRLIEVVEISRCKAPFYPVARRVYVLEPGGA